jgi:hypothetical protein
MESVRVITAVHREHDHQPKSPYLLKRDDPGVSQPLNAQSTEAPFRKLSVTLDRAST